MENDFEKTLQKIEKHEKEWNYKLSDEEDKKHSFGRVPEDGKKVYFWSVPRSTGEYLQFMVELLNSKNVLELGCSVGYSTLFLAKAVQKNNGHVFTTEIFKEKIKLAKQHFQESGLNDFITLLEEDIFDVLKKWEKEKLDFIFMDADKEKYDVYLELLLPLLKPTGLIIVDNAGKVRTADGSLIDCEHIKNFVQKVKSDTRVTSFFLNIDNGLLLIKKK